jgi:uncharacterized membrane protein YhiD involved in acid resistance
LAGVAEGRKILGVGPMRSRLLTTAAVVATVAIGALLNAGAQLATVVAVLVAMLVLERGRHVNSPPTG